MIDGYGFDKAFHDNFMKLLDFMANYYWRIEVEGIENIPEDRGALLVMNHAGTIAIDVLMIKQIIYRKTPKNRIAWSLMADFVTYTPFVGDIYWRTGNVLACWENGFRLLNDDQLVIVCPEGTKGVGKHFIKRYQLVPFGKGGFARLAIQSDVPIIPISVVGSEEIFPVIYKNYPIGQLFGFPYFPVTLNLLFLGPLFFVPIPSKWRIQFGEPIYPSEYKNKGIDIDKIDQIIAQDIENTIKRQLSEQLKKRHFIFF
ncbi:MAG: acyltransferase family protein [Desulfobacterales bacterium]|nr:acyltransferase family protein [Desulfobacterales bacterium]MBF0395340.1 acyltransferase family protein [Desulfobacterales bacterium]